MTASVMEQAEVIASSPVPEHPGSLLRAERPLLDPAELEALLFPSVYRKMIDSAYPLNPEPRYDITLIYAGGDTPHPWTTAQINAMPSRWILPAWVRSNPAGSILAASDAAAFIAWLHGHQIRMGTCVVLDLEIAVDASYVNAFNIALRAAGYKVIKYGSKDYIFLNPRTDGGTFVADPTGTPHMLAEGDTVATQWAFDGSYDLSLVKDQKTVPLHELHVPDPPLPGVTAYQAPDAGAPSLEGLALHHGVHADQVLFETARHRTHGFGPLERRYLDAARLDQPLTAGSWWFIPAA